MAIPSISNGSSSSAGSATPVTKSPLYFTLPNVKGETIAELATPNQLQNNKNSSVFKNSWDTSTKNTNNKWAKRQAGIYENASNKKSSDPILGDHSIGIQTSDVIMKKLNNTLGIQNSSDTVTTLFGRSMKFYNRFKTAQPNAMLRAGYPHVFFIKPSCSLFNNNNKSSLNTGLAANPMFVKAMSSSTTRAMLSELTQTGDNSFMMSLSNAAISFTPQDEYIDDDTYGRGYTGYKIAYGKSIVNSRTAGTINVEFQDDRDLHIYQIHKLWEEYINAAFRGELIPDLYNIYHKVLDYTGGVYYIITAEDNETIIFWTKYYGLFPISAPVVNLSWAAGNILSGDNAGRFAIEYKFSTKRDYDPQIISEFNYNSGIRGSTSYYTTYDSELGHIGTTWVGVPFIEEVSDSINGTYYKLRFKSV